MRLIDRHFLDHPYYGVERMTAYLNYDCGLDFRVNPKRVRRLMRLMNLIPIYPKRNLSQPAANHTIYPYLLRGVTAEHPNHIWATDITYVPVYKGFLYLIAIMDLYSRKILSWDLGNSMTTDWCCSVLQVALETSGLPEIFNTDQGSQFTSAKFTNLLKTNEIRISMNGIGRGKDNAFVERFWRTVKYEYIYLTEFEDGLDLYRGLAEWMDRYNGERRHQSLNWFTPAEKYIDVATPILL